jgi:hypothetical protein
MLALCLKWIRAHEDHAIRHHRWDGLHPNERPVIFLVPLCLSAFIVRLHGRLTIWRKPSPPAFLACRQADDLS